MALLHGKVVCITGSSRGIGRATALECARHGAVGLILHYFGDSTTEDEIRSLEHELSILNPNCAIVAVPGDIADRKTSQQVGMVALH